MLYGVNTYSNHTEIRQCKAFALLQDIAGLVLESVHPANLGALPPSPSLLLRKAHLTGLIGGMEWTETERDALGFVEHRGRVFLPRYNR